MLTEAVKTILLRGASCVWGLWPAKGESSAGGSRLLLPTISPCCTPYTLLFKKNTKRRDIELAKDHIHSGR